MYRILSIDGGGVKGIIPATWLMYLENRLGGKLSDHFDLIAGTSSGAITACGIASGRSAAEIAYVFSTDAVKIFPPLYKRFWHRARNPFGSKYSDKGLENSLKNSFGDLKFGDLIKPTLVVSYDVSSGNPVIFHNEQHAHYNVWEICKSSASAPVFFPPHILQIDDKTEGAMVDGAVVMNNPTALAVVKFLRERASREQKAIIISMGTGSPHYGLDPEVIYRWNIFDWLGNITRIIFDGSTDAIDEMMKMASVRNVYVRFQVPILQSSYEIDNSSSSNMALLQQEARDWIENEGDEDLERIVKILKDHSDSK